jgi:hypothetical protein
MTQWASSGLILTAMVAVVATVAGVIVAPGARGIAGEATVDLIDTASGAFAYLLTALLVSLVCGASFELARTRSVNVVGRGVVVGISGLVVALASPAVVERLGPGPSLVLAVFASLIALVSGILVLRAAHTRMLGGMLCLYAVSSILRIAGWETSAFAADRGSLSVHEMARGLATASVALAAIAALLATAWVSTRSRWRGRLLANLAILTAFGLTWVAARTTESPSSFEAILRAVLPAAAGIPAPYALGAIAAFLVPATILLAAAALVQPKQAPVLIAALAFALLSNGTLDIPLHALLITTSAQWALLAAADRRAVWTPLLRPESA